MPRTHDPRLLAAAEVGRAREAWTRLQLEARRRDLELYRSEPDDGAQHYVTVRRGRTEVHATEADLRLFMRGCH